MPDFTDYVRTLAAAQAQTGSASWQAAAILWERVTSLNPVRGDYWDRLAEARYEMGDYRGALAAYRRAEEAGVSPEGPGRKTTYPAEVACQMAACHAKLGEHEQAVHELRRAVGLGLRDLDQVREDETWKPLLADSRVRDLVGIIDSDGLTRDEGWRADLGFLAREIKRRAYAPFEQVPEPAFDTAVGELSAGIPQLSDMQILAGIMRLLRPVGDGHAFALPAEEDRDARRSLPVRFYSFTEGLFITAVADPTHRSLLGARLIGIGSHDVEELLAAVEPLISRDNTQQVRWLGPEILRWTPLLHALGLIADPGRAVLTLGLPDGTTQDVPIESAVPRDYPLIAPLKLVRFPRPPGWIGLADTIAEPLPLYLRNTDVMYWFEYLPDSRSVYFQFNGVGDQPPEPLSAFCERLFAFIDQHEVTRLIIDLRWNGGGNTFLVRPLLHGLIRCTKINRRGCLYVIIGRGTFSAAQNTTTSIERETNAIFVGEPSGSRPNFIGETIPFTLPCSKAEVNVGDLYWQTSWPDDNRPWIAPDLYTPPTFQAFSRNLDPALDAILECGEHVPGF